MHNKEASKILTAALLQLSTQIPGGENWLDFLPLCSWLPLFNPLAHIITGTAVSCCPRADERANPIC